MQKWKCFIKKQNKITLTLHRPNNTKAKTFRKEKEKLWNSYTTSNSTGREDIFSNLYHTVSPWNNNEELCMSWILINVRLEHRYSNGQLNQTDAVTECHDGNHMWHRMKWQAALQICITAGTGLYSWPDTSQQSQQKSSRGSRSCSSTIPSTLLPLDLSGPLQIITPFALWVVCWCLSVIQFWGCNGTKAHCRVCQRKFWSVIYLENSLNKIRKIYEVDLTSYNNQPY